MPTATKLPPPTGAVAALSLGQIVTDRLTGLKGTVVGIAQFAWMPPRILVCPPKQKPEELKDHWIDEIRLEPGKIKMAVSQPRPTIPLCERVKDSLTGFTGITVGYFFYINGCIHVLVQPTELKDGKPIEDQNFDEGRLEWKGKLVETQADRGGPVPSVRSSGY
jgi:hypothetical protein